MKILFLIIMLLISSIVLSQNTRTFLVDQDTNLVAKNIQDNLIEIDLFFEDSIPSLTQDEISSLLKNGELERFVSKTKGVYYKGILFYIPQDYFEYFYIQKGNVLYIPPYKKQQERVFSWWFMFSLLGIIFMILYQKFYNAVVFVCTAVGAAAFAGSFVAVFTGLFVAVFAFIFAVAFAAAFAGADNRKSKSIFAYTYYVLILLASVLAYYQI